MWSHSGARPNGRSPRSPPGLRRGAARVQGSTLPRRGTGLRGRRPGSSRMQWRCTPPVSPGSSPPTLPAPPTRTFGRFSGPGSIRNQAARARERLAVLGAELGAADVSGKGSHASELDDHATWPLPGRLHGAPGEHVLRVTHADGARRTPRAGVRRGFGARGRRHAPGRAAARAAAPARLASGVAGAAQESGARAAARRAFGALARRRLGGPRRGDGALGGGLVLSLAARDADDAADNAPRRVSTTMPTSCERQAVAMLVVGGVLRPWARGS